MLSAVITTRRSQPAMLLAEQLAHQRSVRLGPLVLKTALLKIPPRAADRDRTVSRRSKPSSRAALMGEQPNPWDRLQPQDATSRHRGAKPPRRYELLGEISLLSPAYLLSFERWPFHAEPPDHYIRLSALLGLWASQSSTLLLLRSAHGYQAC
uniref:Cell wall-associated hydrolase n=1 Tax=Anophryoides haemophila TaxID=46462 RepID=A0A7S3MSY9_9CILI|mmetsp:Transcript_8981/g.1271  ORF Transcript_8981/g.1271 Transcript_8981/m.1271 type:complete len:153 (+) Transcript_8981:140-598(+)